MSSAMGGSQVDVSVFYESYMLKQSRSFIKRWQRRYFRLQHGMLSYMESAETSDQHDSFPLVDVALEIPSKGEYDRDFVFILTTKRSKNRGVYILAAESQAEFNKWTSLLTGAQQRNAEIKTLQDTISTTAPIGIDFGTKLQQHAQYNDMVKLLERVNEMHGETALSGETIIYHCSLLNDKKKRGQDLSFVLVTNMRVVVTLKGAVTLALSRFSIAKVSRTAKSPTLVLDTFATQRYEIVFSCTEHRDFIAGFLRENIEQRFNYAYEQSLLSNIDAKKKKKKTKNHKARFSASDEDRYRLVPVSDAPFFALHESTLALTVRSIATVPHAHVFEANRELTLSSVNHDDGAGQLWSFSHVLATLGIGILRMHNPHFSQKSRSSDTKSNNNSNTLVHEIELLEYQRYCRIRGWSPVMYASQPPAWCTAHHVAMSKDDVSDLRIEEYGCKWTSRWSIKTFDADEHGWTYMTSEDLMQWQKGVDLPDVLFASYRRSDDTIRRRRWARTLSVPTQNELIRVGGGPNLAPKWAEASTWGFRPNGITSREQVLNGSVHPVATHKELTYWELYDTVGIAPFFGMSSQAQQTLIADGMLCGMRQMKSNSAFQWRLFNEHTLFLEYTVKPVWAQIELFGKAIKTELAFVAESKTQPPHFWSVPINDVTATRIFPDPEDGDTKTQVSLYRLNDAYEPKSYSSIVSFGHIVFSHQEEEDEGNNTFLISNDHASFSKVDDFDLEHTVKLSNDTTLYFWRPIPLNEDTHIALGLVATLTNTQPDVSDYPYLRCVPISLTVEVDPSLVYTRHQRFVSTLSAGVGASIWRSGFGTFDVSVFSTASKVVIHDLNPYPEGPYRHVVRTDDTSFKKLVHRTENLLVDMFAIVQEIMQPLIQAQQSAFEQQSKSELKRRESATKIRVTERSRALTTIAEKYQQHKKNLESIADDDEDVLEYQGASSSEDDDAKNDQADDDDASIPPLGIEPELLAYVGSILQYMSGFLTFLERCASQTATQLEAFTTSFEELQGKMQKYLMLQVTEEARFAMEQLQVPESNSDGESVMGVSLADSSNVQAMEDWFLWVATMWPFVRLLPNQTSLRLNASGIDMDFLLTPEELTPKVVRAADASEDELLDEKVTASIMESLTLKRFASVVTKRFEPAMAMRDKQNEFDVPTRSPSKSIQKRQNHKASVMEAKQFLQQSGMSQDTSEYFESSDEEETWDMADLGIDVKRKQTGWSKNAQRQAVRDVDGPMATEPTQQRMTGPKDESKEYILNLNGLLVFLTAAVNDLFSFFHVVRERYVDVVGLSDATKARELAAHVFSDVKSYPLCFSSRAIMQQASDLYHKNIQRVFWSRIHPHSLSGEELLRVYCFLTDYELLCTEMMRVDMTLKNPALPTFIRSACTRVVASYMQKTKQNLFNWMAVTMQSEFKYPEAYLVKNSNYWGTTAPQDIFFHINTVFNNCVTHHKVEGTFAVKMLLVFADVLKYFITTRGNFFKREWFDPYMTDKKKTKKEKKGNETQGVSTEAEDVSEFVTFSMTIMDTSVRDSTYLSAQINDCARFRVLTQDIYEQCLSAALGDEEEDDDKKHHERMFPLNQFVASDPKPEQDKEILENVFDGLELGFNNLSIKCVDIYAMHVVAQPAVKRHYQRFFNQEWCDMIEDAPVMTELLMLLGRTIGRFCHQVQQQNMHWRFVRTMFHLIIGNYLARLVEECLSDKRKGKKNFKLKNFPLVISRLKRELTVFTRFAGEFADVTSPAIFDSCMHHLLAVFPLMYEIFATDDEEFLGVYIPKVAHYLESFATGKFGVSAHVDPALDLSPVHVVHGLLRFTGMPEATRERMLVFFFKRQGELEAAKYHNAIGAISTTSMKLTSAIGMKHRNSLQNEGMFKRARSSMDPQDAKNLGALARGTSLQIFVAKCLYCDMFASGIRNPNLYCKIKLVGEQNSTVLERAKTRPIKGCVNPEFNDMLTFPATVAHAWDVIDVELWHYNSYTANKGIAIGVIPRVVLETQMALQKASTLVPRDGDSPTVTCEIPVMMERTTSSTSARKKQRMSLSVLMKNDAAKLNPNKLLLRQQTSNGESPRIVLFITFVKDHIAEE